VKGVGFDADKLGWRGRQGRGFVADLGFVGHG